MKDARAAWLPDWLLHSPSSSQEGKLTQRAEHPPSDGESQESPGENRTEKWQGRFLHASLGECREACKKGEQTLGFLLPCKEGPDPNSPEASKRGPTVLSMLKITVLNPGHPAKEGAWDTSWN